MMTVGSLFTGIGGFDLGLERAGMRVVWQAETDPFCKRVLAKHWPSVPNLGDVSTIRWEEVDPVDVVCGGFPCQPVSLAGRQRGQSDPRWLWPEFNRCLRILRPAYALLENVPGLLVHGMGDVLGDLARCGYDAEWQSLPAAAFGAPHIRYRVFIVAYPHSDALRKQQVHFPQRFDSSVVDVDGETGYVADANERRREGGARLERPAGRSEPADSSELANANSTTRESTGITSETARRKEVEPGRRGGILGYTDGEGELQPSGSLDEIWGRAGNPEWWTVEPAVGRVAHGIPNRLDRLRVLGNAIVPQVAEAVGRWINE